MRPAADSYRVDDTVRVVVRARTLVVGALVVALIGAGARSLLTPGTSDSRSAPPNSPMTEGTRRPTGGRSRNASGALRAAARFVRAGQRVFDLAPDARDAALRTLAARAAADGYVAQQARQLAELDGIAARGQGPLTWHVGVLATRVDAITRHRARIEIWRLGTLSIDGLTAPIAEFATVSYELVWERGAWRIWSETQTPGPSPMPHPEAIPSSPTEWRTRLEGFVRYPGHEAL